MFISRYITDSPPQVASTETVQYYGAFLLESSPREKVTLQARHVLQDFDYKSNYLQSYVMKEKEKEGAGGAALEHHDFAHLDCPVTAMESSGHFVLAKFINEDRTKIAITGFKVNMNKLYRQSM